MPYKCLQPLKHDGRQFNVGEKVPDNMIRDDQADDMIGRGVLEKVRESVSKKELKEIEKKEVQQATVPDLQSMEQEEALDKINAEQGLQTLYRWQEQEKTGKRRPKLFSALRRQVAEIEKLQEG